MRIKPTILWCIIAAQSVIIAILAFPSEKASSSTASADSENLPTRSRIRAERAREPSSPPPKGRRYFATPTDPSWL